MPRPRKAQICLATTPYYHCVSRCVRRAFLCGVDASSGKDYNHRRQWMESRILELGSIFSIDVASFSIMSNHWHVLLHVDKAQAQTWDKHTVIERWHTLFKGNLLSQRFVQGEPLEWVEQEKLDDDVEKWRKRLYSLSWFMRCINEPMAHQANLEDQCTGRFYKLHPCSLPFGPAKAVQICS